VYRRCPEVLMSRMSWWPSPGSIDLAAHDPPHAEADTEWWYVNAHVRAGGRDLALFAAFFRIISDRDPTTGAPSYAHSMTWALSDLATGRYLGESRVDARSPQLGLERLNNQRGTKDERLNRAMREVLERGQVPAPDRVFDGAVEVAADRLHLQYGADSFVKHDDGSYRVALVGKDFGAELVFAPQKAPARHGDDGVVRGTTGEQMFYYFIPRSDVTGTITLDGQAHAIETGSGWYDHEFGGYVDDPTAVAGEGAGIRDLGWNWCAIQLDDGTDVTAYEIIDVHTHETVGNWMIAVAPDGTHRTITDAAFTAAQQWTSTRTFHTYPTRWRLTSASAGLDLAIDATFADQELITVISKPAFWEGRCDVRGTLGGKPVSGRAYVERSGFENIQTLDEFFSAVGKEVRKSTARALPLEPSHDELRDLIASEELAHYMDGVDAASMVQTLIKPIREMVDRGGKSWRSYAALACCDIVGGDARQFAQWLAMPELLHVGSLIIDDVQDKSDVRRGGPTCHVVHGEPIAINAGTAAYFLTQHLMHSDALSSDQKLRIYDLYFAAMRAGHAGQAIDLAGMDSMMPGVVASGQSRDLEQRILACHRLKTAAPAGCLARMGAVAGGGSDAQVAAVGEWFEAIGLAFQIVDDILNLRGFAGGLKQRGEDISQGKVTLPIAIAMGRLPADQRAWLWSTLQAKPTDAVTVSAAIELVQSCGALAACETLAKDLVEAGWHKAEALFEPSLTRVMLRAFGWYVLERHY
jgi:geranylgeranyl pyrophosphate synthase/predicted secreted hydrolase